MNNLIFVGKHVFITNVPRHAHMDYEIIYCTGGEGSLFFDHMTISYHKDDIIIIPPKQYHTNSGPNGFSNYYMNVRDCTLTLADPILISSSYNETICSAFESSFVFYSSPDMADKDLLSSFGNVIVNYVSLYNPDKRAQELSQTVKKAIISHYSDPNFEIGSHLQELPFSEDYIIKCFKKDFGLTPHKYLTKVRLHCAARLLEHSADHNISEIAVTSGFKDPLYFSRLFKREYGVAPSHYLSDDPVFIIEDPDSLKI